MNTKLIFKNTFPDPGSLADFPVLIYDINLNKNYELSKWIKKFPNRIAVKAGEELKQMKSFERHFVEVLRIVDRIKTKNITLVGLGGGSVGDFVGFMASVFKRGIPLIHIPSTWLAAIDSSHGGKTALNIAGYKNQMGTFYPAKEIFLIKKILFTQPEERVEEAMGEILKTVLLSGGVLWKKASKLKHFSKEALWKLLPELIAYKYKIVKIDPFEIKGVRFFLNFGHTFGHVLESVHGMPHGVAVNYGLRMAIELSLEKNLLSKQEYRLINSSPFIKENLKSLKETQSIVKKTSHWKKHLLQDKKASQNSLIRYVFMPKLGKPVVLSLSAEELVSFTKGILKK